MERNKKIAVIAVIAILCVAGAALLLPNDKDENVLIVETSPDFAPFDYQIGDEFVGIDMDIVRAVCDDMGYSVQFRQNTFDSIILSVEQGKCDIGASGFTISEERGEQVLFSDQYFEIHQVVVAPVGTDIDSADDLVDKVISVQKGTTGADYAEAKSSNPSSNVIQQSSYATVVLDLLQGKADCEIVDEAVGLSQVSEHPEDLVVLDILTDSPLEYYGFIFSKSNTELQEKFNNSLRKLTENGLVQQIIDYYERNGYTTDTPSFFDYKGSLTVETSPDFRPFEYMYGTSYAGIDMDLMRAICNDINYRLDLRNNVFNSIILSVEQGKCDMGASGFTMTDERKEQVLFSDPYYEIHQVVVVPKGSDIWTIDDLKGKTISVQMGTSGAEYAEDVTSNVRQLNTYTEVVLDLLQGKAHCEIVDNTVAQAQVLENPELEIRDILTDAETEYYGFIFSKDNQELCDMINESLARLRENGTLDRIINYYVDHNYDYIPSYYDSDQYVEEEDDEESEGFWGGLWDRFYNDFIKYDRYHYIFDGLKNTLVITALALVIGMVLGAILAMVRSIHDQTGKLKVANAISRVYITVIRGTPMMVQLLLIYYVVFATSDQGILIASVAFGLNSAAYVAEVIRSGITAVPKGQMEACRSLGMPNRTAMSSVILPQSIRNILPALGNESISLLKETSIAGYIGIIDLTRGADIIRGQTYDALFPIIVAAIIYLAIVLVLTYLIRRMERRLNNAY